MSGAVGAILINPVLGGLYAIYKALIPKIPEIPEMQTGAAVSRILNSDYNIPVCYGETRIGGNIVFYDVTGTDNKYLDIVSVICEGEIEGFTKVFMDDGAIPIFDGFGSTLTTGSKQTSTHPLYGKLKSTGTLKFNSYSLDNDSIVFIERTPTGITSAGVPIYSFNVSQIYLSDIGSTNLTTIVNYLNASGDANFSRSTYAVRSDNTGIDITYDTAGADGNKIYYNVQRNKANPKDASSIETTDEVIASVGLSGGNATNWIEAYFYNGTDAQAANTQLISAYPPTADSSGWTSNHTLSGLAYVYIRLIYNPDLFQGGIPKFSFELKGKKTYDPRTSTTIFSDNPAVCLRDYLLNTRYGKGLDTAVLNDPSIITAANYCDTLRNGLDVSGNPITYKSYTIGGNVDTSNKIKDNTQYFLQTMNGVFPYFDGAYYVTVLQSGTASSSFSEDNIIGPIALNSSTKNDRYNRVLITFPDKDRHFKKGDAPIENATYLAEDNNQLLEKRIEAPYVNYYPQARDIAELAMNVSRIGLNASFTTTMEVLKSVPGDIIDITWDAFGWVNKAFRIEKIVSRLDGLCDISVSEHDNAFYSLSTQQEQLGSSTTNLVDPKDVLKPEIDSIVSDSTTHLLNADGSITPRILVTWTNLDSYPYYYEIYVRDYLTTTTFTKIGQVSRDDGLAFYIPNVVWGQTYDVGIAVVNGLGYTSALAVSSITVQNPLASTVYNYPDVTGLELIGENTDIGKGNNTSFTGQDIKLQWRLSSNNVTLEFGSIAAEELGAVGGVVPFTLKNYRIEVYHSGDTTPRQEYYVAQPNFIYSLDKNIEDGGGTPARSVTFKVYAVGQVSGYNITGESEKAATISVSNPAPTLPSNVVISKGFQTIGITYDRPSIGDWSGILVWMDTVTGFTPSATNLVYTGLDNTILLSGLTSGATYYIKYALRDTFVPPSQTDITGLTASAEYSITTDVAVTSSEIQSLIADKIAAGTLGEAVTLGGVFIASGVSSVLNGTGPTVGTWRLDLGPVVDGGTTYIQRFHDGAGNTTFNIDSLGNVSYAGSILSSGLVFNAQGSVHSSGMTSETPIATGGIWAGYNSTSSKYTFGVGNTTDYLTFDGTNLSTSGKITGSEIQGSSFTTTGSYLTTATTGSETTIYVYDTTDFATSGSGWILDSTNDRDAFTWTGKTATTLTGCSGVLAHAVDALVLPQAKQILLSEQLNEMRFYGDRGDGTIQELANIGVKSDGTDLVIGYFGSLSSSQIGLLGQSDTNAGIYGQSASAFAGVFAGVNSILVNNTISFEDTLGTPSLTTGGFSYTNTYVKGDKFIIQYDDAGTIRYKYLTLSGTGTTWVHTTTAP